MREDLTFSFVSGTFSLVITSEPAFSSFILDQLQKEYRSRGNTSREVEESDQGKGRMRQEREIKGTKPTEPETAKQTKANQNNTNKTQLAVFFAIKSS